MSLEFFAKVYIIVIFILQVSNLLYVDQPIGTGFSYSSDPRDIRHNEESISNDLYDFLQVHSSPSPSPPLFGLIFIFFCNHRI